MDMSRRMEWEGGPGLLGLKHMIEKRERHEKHLQEFLDRVQGRVSFPWEDDEVMEDMLRELEAEMGISFSSWTV
jgi:hypothetical protein